MIENKVVLPAPFGPMSAMIWPVAIRNDAPSTTSKPPKRLETFSTSRSTSAIAALHLGRTSAAPPQSCEQPSDAARRQSDHTDQKQAIDHKIKSGRIPRDHL